MLSLGLRLSLSPPPGAAGGPPPDTDPTDSITTEDGLSLIVTEDGLSYLAQE